MNSRKIHQLGAAIFTGSGVWSWTENKYYLDYEKDKNFYQHGQKDNCPSEGREKIKALFLGVRRTYKTWKRENHAQMWITYLTLIGMVKEIYQLNGENYSQFQFSFLTKLKTVTKDYTV